MLAPSPYLPWAAELIAVVNRVGLAPSVADLDRVRAVLATEPGEGLTCEWHELAAELRDWLAKAEAARLPVLRAERLFQAALSAPPQPRAAWQDRSDLT